MFTVGSPHRLRPTLTPALTPTGGLQQAEIEAAMAAAEDDEDASALRGAVLLYENDISLYFIRITLL